MSWFEKILPNKVTRQDNKKGVPKGIWTQCPGCKTSLFSRELQAAMHVCSKCNHHLYISARERLELFFNKDTTTEIAKQVVAKDILSFKDTKPYGERLVAAEKKSSETEGLIAFYGKLFDLDVVATAFDFKFIGGSMGAAVGQRFVLAANYALKHGCPFICFVSSGGARMQEGLTSLMQMAKTAAVIGKLNTHQLPYITILTHPTTGGVAASLASLGDVVIAEPKALIGFAGPRVIAETVKEVLPEGFQRSEFLLTHGAIDMIVDRRDIKQKVYSILSKLMNK